MLYAIAILAIIALWDASRRWAERNDEYDPDEIEDLWDHLHAVEELTKTISTLHAARENQSEHITTLLAFSDRAKDRLDDLAKCVANHAQALEGHGKALTAMGLNKTSVARRGGDRGTNG